MIRRYIVPFLAVIGFVIAVGVVFYGNRPPPAALPATQSAKAPFPSYIAGAGITEASTENVAVGTQVSGVVTNICVKRGDTIKSGDPLFTVDDRDLQAQLLPASAKVKEGEANLAKAKDHLDRGERLSNGNKGAISIQDMETGALMQRLSRRLLLRQKPGSSRSKGKSRFIQSAPLCPDGYCRSIYAPANTRNRAFSLLPSCFWAMTARCMCASISMRITYGGSSRMLPQWPLFAATRP